MIFHTMWITSVYSLYLHIRMLLPELLLQCLQRRLDPRQTIRLHSVMEQHALQTYSFQS